MATGAAESYRDGFITANLDLVTPIARSLARCLPPSFEIDDLISAGYVGLIRAADAYAPAAHGGVPFAIYARKVVRGAMLDTVQGRHDGVAGRHWIAHTARPLADAPEPVCAPAAEALVETGERLRLVAAAARGLTANQRAILKLCYGPAAASLQEAAASLGLSYRGAHDLHSRAIARLRSRCAEDGGGSRRLSVMPSRKVKSIDGAKAAPLPNKTPAELELEAKLAAEVDELGALEKELAPLKPKLDRVELLRKSVRARYDASPAGECFEAKGSRFVVMVGARANQSVIDHARLFKAIGAKLFQSLAKTTLKALEENVSCAVRADVVSVQQIGARSLKTFERGTPEVPKAA